MEYVWIQLNPLSHFFTFQSLSIVRSSRVVLERRNSYYIYISVIKHQHVLVDGVKSNLGIAFCIVQHIILIFVKATNDWVNLEFRTLKTREISVWINMKELHPSLCIDAVNDSYTVIRLKNTCGPYLPILFFPLYCIFLWVIARWSYGVPKWRVLSQITIDLSYYKDVKCGKNHVTFKYDWLPEPIEFRVTSRIRIWSHYKKGLLFTHKFAKTMKVILKKFFFRPTDPIFFTICNRNHRCFFLGPIQYNTYQWIWSEFIR